MQLNDLLKAAGLAPVSDNVEISGITADSRKAASGFLFAALPGSKADGASFVQDAADNGARAALVPLNAELPNTGMIYVRCDDVRKSLALIAAAFYGKQPQTVVAVTGTNGKTSTANFARQIWDFLGKKSASVGTLGVISSDFSSYGSLTTPDPVLLHETLSMLADKGIEKTAIEASSHGIDQHRIDGVRLTAAAFTNITRDHLDYHKTMENYLEAKLKLFDRPLSSNTVVLNADIPEFDRIKSYCLARGLKIIDYGKNAEALKLVDTALDIKGQTLHLEIFGKKHTVRLPLAGTFQAMNALCALGLVIAAGEDAQQAVKGLEILKGAPGRMEHVADRKNGAAVYVDYAHTPDALETVLNALRPHTQNRLCVVFGCGGDRDPGKRPQMGEIADRLADVVYVTDDNPRTEKANAIRDQILPACPKGIDIGNRALAIETAVSELRQGDILILAGKGHETGQLINGVVYPFDDREEAKKAVLLADTPLWTSDEIVTVTKGKCDGYFEIFGISIDTRTLEKGDLFIALKGDKSDGHLYAADALKKGAAGILASYVPEGVPAEKSVLVEDPLKALENMARHARTRGHAKVIGITGSSGKTSTKEMLRYALTAVGRTHCTQGNLNNQIGMPLTLARMPKTTDFAVIEMGMNHTGEMHELTMLAHPDIAVVTMVGSAHREFFPTEEDTVHAKAEIFDGMDRNGRVFLNADNRPFSLLKEETEKRGLTYVYFFGKNASNDISLVKSREEMNKTYVKAKVFNTEYSWTLKLPGEHQVLNSLAVAGVLKVLNVDMETALQGLSQLPVPKGRGQRFVLPCVDHGTFILIDDAYNANPESMRAAIKVLGGLVPDGNGRRIAVLGDMLELGEFAPSLHKGLAVDLIENNIDLLYAVGENTGLLFDQMPPQMRGRKESTASEMAKRIACDIKDGDIVLVKGSFGSRMAEIVDVLKNGRK